MISKSEYLADVRVRRESEALAADGHAITVIDATESDLEYRNVTVKGTGRVSGLGSHRSTTDSIGFRIARWMLLPEHRQRANSQFQSHVLARADDLEEMPDVVHAHDFPALLPGALLADRFGSKLVYDAHEYWYGLPRYGRPEPVRKRRNRATERHLSQKADRVITVSEGAAALLARDFDLGEISVVRNTFPTHADLDPPDRPTGVVYAGKISRGRDLEMVFTSGIWDEGFELSAMGPQDGSIAVPDHVRVIPSAPLDDVDKLLSTVGLAIVPLERGPKNHDIALPNKLFQAVSVGVPVVASDLPEIARVVNEYQLGTLYQSGDRASFARAVGLLVEDYPAYLANVKDARKELSWDQDSARLQSLYASLRLP